LSASASTTPVWDHSSFSKNRDRLLEGEIVARFLDAVRSQPRVRRLMSSEHFSVDGTLIQAWASMKSFKPKQPPGNDRASGGGGRNAPADFRGQKRSNETHQSTTDPDARLYRKGPGMEAKLCFIGHGRMENRCGLIVDARLTRVSGQCRTPGSARHGAAPRRPTVRDHARRRSRLRCGRLYRRTAQPERAPHVAQNTSGRGSAIDKRTTRYPGYAASQPTRKRIGEAFRWIRSVVGPRQTKLRGLAKVDWAFTFAAGPYNLVPKLIGATT
jgi:hypothetical protein